MKFFRIFLVAVLHSGLSHAEKPNIVFMFADDQMWSALGAIEGSQVKTPNLDRLKARGAYFRYAYNMGSYSAAVCASSRTMLVTGKTV